MIPLSIAKITEVAKGQSFEINPETVISADFSIDSRAIHAGGIFVAIKGEKVDGRDFAAQALAAGALCVLTEKQIAGPCIVVSDVIQALGEIAHYVRQQIPNLKVIGITGSQGKTTTKDLLAHVLGAAGKTHAAKGSYNNDLGAPLTLLECQSTTKFCIVEMGARHPGDIARLTKIAEPNVGVVLKVGNAHIGEFGSRENIARTKKELIDYLPASGIAVLGTYDEFTPHMVGTEPATQESGNANARRTLLFGERHVDDVRAADIEFREGRAHFDLVTPAGREPVGLRIVGTHQIANALAAAAAATALGLPIEQISAALSTAEVSSKWRMELHDLNGLLVINDAYNANPESMAAALRTLALLSQERGGRSWAFLGTMHELGEESSRDHSEIGQLAENLGIDHLVSIGNSDYCRSVGSEIQTHQFQSTDDAAEMFQHFQSGDVVLVKASRAEALERLAESALVYWRTTHIGEMGETQQ